jgi:hypothetical protein
MHKLLVGIEHLMTGVQLTSDSPITFERESASVMRAMSVSTIQAYWPLKQSFMESVEEDREREEYSSGEAEFYARVYGHAMRGTDTWALDQLEIKGVPRPGEAVVKAMRRKFGAMADKYITQLKWDGLGKYYYFTHAGMYHGVEPDGYIHT